MAIVDRRHAKNNSPQAEHVGLHASLRSLYRLGVPVSELVTDEHRVVIADMSKEDLNIELNREFEYSLKLYSILLPHKLVYTYNAH